MKTCRECGTDKPLTEFHLKRGKPQARCKVCRSEYMAKLYEVNKEVERRKRKAWYEKNKLIVSEKGKADRKVNAEERRLNRRLKKYGITKNQYFEKLEEQDHACAICKKPFTETPAIDHCHTFGHFRGLLCDNHNTALGLLDENIAYFLESIAYLTKYKK